jgi:fructose-specific phosphotransferase system IIA component
MHQMIASDDTSKSSTFNFMKYLSQNTMIVPLESNDKKGVINELISILQKAGKITQCKEVYDEVIEREDSMSTGLGDGVAFPHARTDDVNNITVAMGVSPQGIEFNSIDKKPVYIVALILSPKKDSTPHLQFLSEMSKVLSRTSAREKIISVKNTEELYRLFEDKNW